jgi:hypothetical protein
LGNGVTAFSETSASSPLESNRPMETLTSRVLSVLLVRYSTTWLLLKMDDGFQP